MKLLFTILFSFSFCFLNGQTVIMKVEKPNKDSVVEWSTQGMTFETDAVAAESVVSYVDVNPVYPGGDAALAAFIAKNLNSKLANERNIYGSVYTSFIVDTAGQISDIQIKRGIDSVLDAEAFRVVSLLGRWQPGTTRGKPVSVQYYLPIWFVRN